MFCKLNWHSWICGRVEMTDKYLLQFFECKHCGKTREYLGWIPRKWLERDIDEKFKEVEG